MTTNDAKERFVKRLPRKAGPIARHYLELLRDEIEERMTDLNRYRALCVNWARFCATNGDYKQARAYVKNGEILGEQLLVHEARVYAIDRLMGQADVDAGWD